MNETRAAWRWWVLVLAAIGTSIPPACGLGEEERAKQFLDRLRSRQQYDAALEFLEKSRTSDLASAEFREVIDFELGVTRLEASRFELDAATRKESAAKAADSFRKFVEEHNDHPLAVSAYERLASSLTERGRDVLGRAKRAPADEEAALRQEARRLFGEALQQLLACEKLLFGRLAKIPNVLDNRKDRELILERDRLRASYLQAQLLIGALHEELADTWTPSDKEHRQELTAAAEQYGDVYRRYRTRLAGLYAHLYQGRCLQKLGEFDAALKNYDTILQQPDDPEMFRSLKTKTLSLALECWIDPTQKQYARAVTEGESWLQKVPPAEAGLQDGKRIRELVEQARRLKS